MAVTGFSGFLAFSTVLDLEALTVFTGETDFFGKAIVFCFLGLLLFLTGETLFIGTSSTRAADFTSDLDLDFLALYFETDAFAFLIDFGLTGEIDIDSFYNGMANPNIIGEGSYYIRASKIGLAPLIF